MSNQPDAWNPTQYDKFKDQRSKPFFDLMGLLIKTDAPPKIVDLGCGTGELTAQLHHDMQAYETVGIDSSDEMLAKSKAFTRDGLTFIKGDISAWSAQRDAKLASAFEGRYDIALSNAAIQWCDDHPGIFRRVKDSLRPGGQIAIQMPMNQDYPTHMLASEMALEPKWSAMLNRTAPQQNMLRVEDYAELLFSLGFRQQDVQLRVYAHELESREEVIEWVKGTLLTSFKSRLTESDYAQFLSEFRTRLFAILPDRRPFFYPFKRVLIWGRL